ncbi:MAG: hypothetical protein ACK54P_04240 [Bacteroidota bacterium]
MYKLIPAGGSLSFSLFSPRYTKPQSSAYQINKEFLAVCAQI